MTSTILGAHRTTQEKERLTVFEIWTAERNGKTGELAQRGADLHGGPLAEIRASEVTQARIEVSLAVEHVAHFLCLVNEWVDREDILPKEEHMEVCEQSEEANEHRMEWCVGINRCSMHEMLKRSSVAGRRVQRKAVQVGRPTRRRSRSCPHCTRQM